MVGDVKSRSFTNKKTKLAQSTYDAGWFELKRQLEYKCKHAGCRFEIVNEKYTTQTCSCCRQIDSNSPKGRAGLRIREWTCAKCGTRHDSDLTPVGTFLRSGLTVL
ncbi:transposase, IS605 OrfB family [Moraxella catarrhalis]|uniref:Transposase, IS605 OrfB family n=1 Tax=Moraxella catarrhalis TaxID=480 RepID=A0ABY0BIF0_MORCA|nr:transposase, IS605 OrfB family [Moraxella catarrhalis]RUO15295.1 transposase, IS605 OrfB family [Moraxella catarrhalis]